MAAQVHLDKLNQMPWEWSPGMESLQKHPHDSNVQLGLRSSWVDESKAVASEFRLYANQLDSALATEILKVCGRPQRSVLLTGFPGDSHAGSPQTTLWEKNKRTIPYALCHLWYAKTLLNQILVVSTDQKGNLHWSSGKSRVSSQKEQNEQPVGQQEVVQKRGRKWYNVCCSRPQEEWKPRAQSLI